MNTFLKKYRTAFLHEKLQRISEVSIKTYKQIMLMKRNNSRKELKRITIKFYENITET